MSAAEAAAQLRPAVPARRSRHWGELQTWRLGSGLVLFAFALTHFLNHALGHISLPVMEEAQVWRQAVWRSWPGTILLYGALAVHVALALWKLVRRRTWRMPLWEAAQIGLGLTIPFLAVGHVMSTRALNAFHGFDDTYEAELRLLWPNLAFSQSLLLMIVWLHAMIGFHFWLRLKAWYAVWSPVLLVLAMLVPTLAITGWIAGARRVALEPTPVPPRSADMTAAAAELIERAQAGIWTIFAIAVSAIVFFRLIDWFRRGPAIAYVGGRTTRAIGGATLLEISRAAGIAHASVCGGRGRCTTCRVLVVEGEDRLPRPNPKEAAALARIDAPPGVRLACQIRPEHALKVRPLIPLKSPEPVGSRDDYRWGVERRVTVMFTDLRGFTSLAERLYPYDSVFLLNRYFDIMSRAIERNGGEVDKYLGDGIMALFGVAPGSGSGGRDALLAARDMLAGLDHLNEDFQATLPEGLRMGIGIHTGPAVLGRVGGGRAAGLTALGDSVNIASRLETLNKEFGSVLVVSEATLQASGLALEGAELRMASVRGREEGLRVAVAFDLHGLREAPGAEAVA